eukprot:TRINITY_DN15524_c0_g1_i1.p1 TRINITY_DN15524_c0_g1~~TRINITY_DN15524_c0_g1_i1.p1  ORF type:complete len:365 (-),score=51.01 TRINITY_DN15524_c0_g1_i1:318-1412(-)
MSDVETQTHVSQAESNDGIQATNRVVSRSPRRRVGRGRGRGVRKAQHGRWPGCHVAHHSAPWILGTQDLDSAGFGNEEDLPDISIDPDEKILSVINTTEEDRCYCLTLPASCGCRSASGRKLATGSARDADSSVREIITFMLVLGPKQVMDVCELRGPGARDPLAVEVQSDIVPILPPPVVLADAVGFPQRYVYKFPLEGGPFLCSQGAGGKLTHFAHPSTYHALDFDCPVGTEVLAIEDGTVVEVRDSEQVSGADVRNFFRWNQVTVQQRDGTLAEYVHIQAGSASQRVSVGDTVRRGQQLCCSGDIGFCPTPHLHLEVHLEAGPTSPSVAFGFAGDGDAFSCEEGKWYTSSGLSCAGRNVQE